MTNKVTQFFYILFRKFQNRIKNYGVKKKYKSDLLFLFFLLVFASSGFCSYVVPTASMDPTIKIQDRFFANKLSYRLKIPFTKQSVIDWNTPQQGDIIVFKYPKDESIPYTKRVIAVPGDKIELVNKQVFVNSAELQLTLLEETSDHYLFEENLNGLTYKVKFSKHIELTDNMPEITVPEGQYFVMGDNRNNSSDSRIWGFVPIDNIDGKLTFRWFGFKEKSYLPDLDRLGKLE
ncbi:signal peptidase I [Lentisphaera marina]|uniref:signal peptidase I n=1 Tax=Lentisphaera marina TaxID=1111041 RepID=UPI0023652091|nr:signal peptidase I [Lentisphaera marina]MDD7985402.1 signal peptidase I [Lentisphaera marina]